MEVPIRKILLGAPPEESANASALANPESLAFSVHYALTQRDYSLPPGAGCDAASTA